VVISCSVSRRRSAIRAWIFAAFSRALLLLRRTTLLPGQSGTVTALAPGVGDLLPGREGRKMLQPGVDADRTPPRGQWLDAGVVAQQEHFAW
jgi:hypothetical protein